MRRRHDAGSLDPQRDDRCVGKAVAERLSFRVEPPVVDDPVVDVGGRFHAKGYESRPDAWIAGGCLFLFGVLDEKVADRLGALGRGEAGSLAVLGVTHVSLETIDGGDVVFDCVRKGDAAAIGETAIERDGGGGFSAAGVSSQKPDEHSCGRFIGIA